MLANVSTEIIRELKQKSRTFRAKIYRKSTGELLTENVRALNCTAASSDGTDITVGQAFSRALTFSCADIGLKEGDEINVVIALKVRSNFVGGNMPYGEFTITNAVKGLDGIDYTAYDKLYINSTKDVTHLPISFDGACTAIGNLIGAPFSKADSDVYPYGSNSQSHLSAIKKFDETAGYKALEVAGYLAGLVGCNAFVNRSGNLVFKAQQDVEIGYALDDRIDDKTLEFQVTIGSIEVRGARGAEDVYTLDRANSKGAKLYTENPLAMSASDVAWRIDNRMTHGADIVNKGTLVMKLGDPRIDPWDIINNYACSTLTMDFDGGIITTIESIVKTDQERQIEEKDRFKQVKAELEAMQSAVDDVASGFEGLESDFGDLSGSVDDLETEVGEIGGGLDELGGTVDDLSGEVDLMGDSIEDLEDEVETINANYEAFLADYNRFKAQAEAGLGSTTGYYKTEQKVNDATITYMHDQPKLSDSTYIWKFTIDSIACSIDGGKTYPFGMTVDGQFVQQYITSDYISSLSISAGAIKSGTMSCDRLSGGTVRGQKIISTGRTTSDPNDSTSQSGSDTNLQIHNGVYSDFGKCRLSPSERTKVWIYGMHEEGGILQMYSANDLEDNYSSDYSRLKSGAKRVAYIDAGRLKFLVAKNGGETRTAAINYDAFVNENEIAFGVDINAGTYAVKCGNLDCKTIKDISISQFALKTSSSFTPSQPTAGSVFSAFSGSIKKYSDLGFVIVTLRLSLAMGMTAGQTYTVCSNTNIKPSIPAALSCVWYGTSSRLKKVVQAYVNSSGDLIVSPTEDIAGEGYLAVTGSYLV